MNATLFGRGVCPWLNLRTSQNINFIRVLIIGALAPTASIEAAVPVFSFAFGETGSGAGQFKFPLGMCLDASNNVYVCDAANNRLQKFSATGQYLTQWGIKGTTMTQFNWPDGAWLDSSGNVFVAQYNSGWVQKFSSVGAYITSWKAMLPGALVLDRSDNVYVADFPGVQKYADDGSLVTNLVAVQQNAVALDTLGNLYCISSGAQTVTVTKYGVQGQLLTQWGSVGTNTGQLNSPQGLAVDRRGIVYVADSSNNRIQTFDSNGNFIAQWGTYGTNAGEFSFPCRIAVDASGRNIYVADSNNNRVQVFSYPEASLQNASTAPSGFFKFDAGGITGWNYVIQASTDLKTWTGLFTNTAPFTFTDTESPAHASRVYRAIVQP